MREREELDNQKQLIPFGQFRVGSPDPHHHFLCPKSPVFEGAIHACPFTARSMADHLFSL